MVGSPRRVALASLAALGAELATGSALLARYGLDLGRLRLVAIVLALLVAYTGHVASRSCAAVLRDRVVARILARWLNHRSEALHAAIVGGLAQREERIADLDNRLVLERRLPSGLLRPSFAVMRIERLADDGTVADTLSVFFPRGEGVDGRRPSRPAVEIARGVVTEPCVNHQYAVVGAGTAPYRVLAFDFDEVCVAVGADEVFLVRIHGGVPIVTVHADHAALERQLAVEFGRDAALAMLRSWRWQRER